MKKQITRTFYPNDGSTIRTFECHITDVMGGGNLLEVSVWEVRPVRKWWQFRTRYFGNHSFWVDDHNTIMDGIDHCLSYLLLEEKEYNERRKKFEEFEKNS